MSKVIWIINQYGSTPATGMGGRHFYLSKALAKRGHIVKVICASNHHLLSQAPYMDSEILEQRIDGVTYVWLKMPPYKGANSKKRIWNWITFAAKLPSLPHKLDTKPDVILCSSPSLISFLGAERLAHKTGARLVSEVRDIWPKTFVELGGRSTYHPFIYLLGLIERRMYRNSYAVISNLEYAATHMIARGMDEKKFLWISNGFDVTQFRTNEEFIANFKVQLPSDKLILGYVGTMGRANALDTIIDAAKLLEHRDDLAFVFVGSGTQKEVLIKRSAELKLSNVHFYDSVPKDMVPSVLATFDACLLSWHDSILYDHGVGANKLYEYLAAGRPILQAYSGAGDLVSEYEAGITVEAGKPAVLANAIKTFAELPSNQREKMSENGRSAAHINHEYDILGAKLENLLLHDELEH